MKESLQELNRFLGKASLATYAGGGPEARPQRPGFRELEYKDGNWEYRDSYTGFFRSWGQEVVWHNGQPYWTQLYGGGMVEELINNETFAHQTFDFLKKALSDGEKQEEFQPRGPSSFTDGDWEYSCEWQGDIANFEGHEKILLNGKVVFTHDFMGGLILSREK